jgi:hypothetical protein
LLMPKYFSPQNWGGNLFIIQRWIGFFHVPLWIIEVIRQFIAVYYLLRWMEALNVYFPTFFEMFFHSTILPDLLRTWNWNAWEDA